MATTATKIEFLRRAMGRGPEGHGLEPLMTDDLYVRDNIVVACESLSLKLVRLVPDREGFGFQIRITPGGKLLAEGRIEEAAAAIDSGNTVTRLWGEDPVGIVASRLYPGGAALPLTSGLLKAWTPEVLRGIATGSFVVQDGMIRGVERPIHVYVPRISTLPMPSSPVQGAQAPSLRGHDRGTLRHVGMRGR